MISLTLSECKPKFILQLFKEYKRRKKDNTKGCSEILYKNFDNVFKNILYLCFHSYNLLKKIETINYLWKW